MSNVKRPLRINFVIPPVKNISGGPLALIEYANRFLERGHSVTITTYPKPYWRGEHPMPWANFKGKFYYPKLFSKKIGILDTNFIMPGKSKNRLPAVNALKRVKDKIARVIYSKLSDFNNMKVASAIPDCDVNIATFWETAYPVFLSKKGRLVYFMQHYEEVFYPPDNVGLNNRLKVRMSYQLPLYKIANSSWLKNEILRRFGIDIPFSNNGLEISDFYPQTKYSESDGIIRVIVYSRPDLWKGFQDALCAMKTIKERYGSKVELHAFGYLNENLSPDNQIVPYTFHKNLSFKQLARLYATSDIVLCPSWYESFPLPPLEAMASGTAVITTKYGVEDYAVDQVNSLVVNPRAIPEMITALIKLIESSELRKKLVASGLETARRFTWEVAVLKREELLYKVMESSIDELWYHHNAIDIKDGDGKKFDVIPEWLVLPPAKLIKGKNSDKIYYLGKYCKQYIFSKEAFNLCGFNLNDVNVVDDLMLLQIPTGNIIYKKEDIGR